MQSSSKTCTLTKQTLRAFQQLLHAGFAVEQLLDSGYDDRVVSTGTSRFTQSQTTVFFPGTGVFFNAKAIKKSGGVYLSRVTISPDDGDDNQGGEVTVWATRENLGLTDDEDPLYTNETLWQQVGGMSNLMNDGTTLSLTVPVYIADGETKGVYIHYTKGLAQTAANPSPMSDHIS